VKRSYDAAGSMRAVVDLVTGIRVERDYDALLRQVEERVYLDAENLSGDGVLWTRLKYAYSAAGDRTGMAMWADLGDGQGEQLVLARRFGYDERHLLVEIADGEAGGWGGREAPRGGGRDGEGVVVV
jgi:hypothetical protein